MPRSLPNWRDAGWWPRNAERLKLSEYGGAELTCNLGDGDPMAAIMNLSGGRGCAGVIIAAATDSSEPFDTAAAIAQDQAKVSLIGVTGTEFTTVHL